MQLQEAVGKQHIGFAEWKVPTQTSCMMAIIPSESLNFDAACEGMMAFCGEAVACVFKVRAMEVDEQFGDEQRLLQFPQYFC